MGPEEQRPPPDLDRVRDAMREERDELEGERQRREEEEEEEKDSGE